MNNDMTREDLQKIIDTDEHGLLTEWNPSHASGDINFDKLVMRIQRFTDNNDHTESVISLTNYEPFIGNPRVSLIRMILLNIVSIHEIEGSMPKELSDYRYRLLNELLSYVTNEDHKTKLHGAF